ncbi:MAG: cysteine hydrolase [Lachnospiraceae bacterium]|nr:cysteine hydrolase [Lachnospiraceae bacterium]
MKKILVVVDMQNDFISGSLGTKEAELIVDKVAAKIRKYRPEDVFATLDTHSANYLETAEGKNLPVEHCIRGTSGWELNERIKELLTDSVKIEKPTFGSLALADHILNLYNHEQELEIELVGLCTDICVVTNALLLKTKMPEAMIKVDASCCAGVTKESHDAALLTMKMCQIAVVTGNEE